ncbi:hypothetical protein KIPB_014683, partial [Kipferlia bialata]
LPTEACPPLLSALTSEHTALHTAYQGVRALDFDPAESVAVLRRGVALLDSINKIHIIPLPSDHSSLSLKGKRKYFQVKQYNALVEELYTIAGKIIDCQPSIEQCMCGLGE